ncbi:MAG: Hsp20/alpha crystallin family protein [Patescibacteria group bacterium]
MDNFEGKNDSSVLGIRLDAPSPENYRPSFVPDNDNSALWDDNAVAEGKLAVDVSETEKDVIVVSAIAGASLDKIEIHLHNDLLTIRGERYNPLNEIGVSGFFYQECFWGNFSRSVVLPVETRAELARAEYKNGILCVIIPKRKADTRIPVLIVED